MTQLQDFYNARVAALGDGDTLSHVGHTLGGAALAPEMTARMTAELLDALAPTPETHVLDLCCGNGYFTRQFASHAASVTGVDFSSELIRVATAQTGAAALRYFVGDVARLSEIAVLKDRRYARVVMNTSLQHFAPRSFGALLDQILTLTTEAPVLVFSYIPAHGRERAFFDTRGKRLRRAWLKLRGRDIFGHWWRQTEIAGPARQRGLTCSFPPVDPALPYATYRMTARLAR